MSQPKVKHVTQVGTQVTVEYDGGGVSIQNFDSTEAANDYRLSHGHVRPKPAEKPKAAAKKKKTAKKK